MTRGTGVNHAAQQRIGTLVSLEGRSTLAAGLAGDLATSLRRREADLDIAVRPRSCCADEPRPCMHDVVDLGAQSNNGLQDGADFGDEQLVSLDLARGDLQLARETISESASLAASAGVSAPELEALPQPRAIRDAETGLAATRRWHTLTRAQGKPRSAGPLR